MASPLLRVRVPSKKHFSIFSFPSEQSSNSLRILKIWHQRCLAQNVSRNIFKKVEISKISVVYFQLNRRFLDKQVHRRRKRQTRGNTRALVPPRVQGSVLRTVHWQSRASRRNVRIGRLPCSCLAPGNLPGVFFEFFRKCQALSRKEGGKIA